MTHPCSAQTSAGGTFNRGEDGLFDAPQGARFILQAMLQAHAGDLEVRLGYRSFWDHPSRARRLLGSPVRAFPPPLPQALRTADGAQSLAELAGAGVKSTTASVVVAAAIRLKDELAQQTQRRVLLAVDDYNALYHRTTYGEAVHPLHRRLLRPDELRLVRRSWGGVQTLVIGKAWPPRDCTPWRAYTGRDVHLLHAPRTPRPSHTKRLPRCGASG